MMNDQYKQDCTNVMFAKRISWSAIIVGALVGVGLGFLLNLFSVAIGLSAFRATTEGGAMTLAVGGLVGLAIGTIVSMYLAGWVAGYLGRPYCLKRNLGVLYGFVTWSVALVLTVILTAHLGHYVTTYSNFVSNPNVVTLATTDMPAQATANNAAQANDVVVVNAQTTNTMGMGAFVIFILFALGAVSSCFGGHYGMECSCEGGREKFDE